jgi:transcriptional regulator with XRE-family HTH domain
MAIERAPLIPDYCQMAKDKRNPRPKLKEARKAAGLSLETLAAEVGLSPSQISRFESGDRDPRDVELAKIAQVIGVDVLDLIDTTKTVPLVGYVGAGAETHLFADGQGPFDQVEAPEGASETTVAVEIRGESLGALFDQWLIFYDRVERPVTSDLIGRLCVVGLADGRILVKKLRYGQLHGHYNLISNTEAPIYDVEIAWAARVKQMTPR